MPELEREWGWRHRESEGSASPLLMTDNPSGTGLGFENIGTDIDR